MLPKTTATNKKTTTKKEKVDTGPKRYPVYAKIGNSLVQVGHNMGDRLLHTCGVIWPRDAKKCPGCKEKA